MKEHATPDDSLRFAEGVTPSLEQDFLRKHPRQGHGTRMDRSVGVALGTTDSRMPQKAPFIPIRWRLSTSARCSAAVNWQYSRRTPAEPPPLPRRRPARRQMPIEEVQHAPKRISRLIPRPQIPPMGRIR